MNSIREHTRLLLFASVVVTLWMLAPRPTTAQAVRPEMTASHPAPDVALFAERWLETDRPRIAIHRPGIRDGSVSDAVRRDTDVRRRTAPRRNADVQTTRHRDTDVQAASIRNADTRAARVRDAVTAWELFLLGLEVPYTVVGDEILEDGLDRSIDVLVMPAAAWASEASIRNAARFVRSGGGLVASGAPASHSPAREHLEALLGVRFEPFAAPVAGLYQVLNRLPVLQTGVPPGARLNVAVFGSFQPVRSIDSDVSTALGPLIPYGSDSMDAFAGLTGAVQASPGTGRVIWTAFMPQDVSREPDQQLAWQRFALGALGHVGGLPTLSVESWPAASPAALGIAVLPSPGHDPFTMLRNMQHLLGFLEEEDLPATFFLPGYELHPYAELVRRIEAAGDFGATTRSGHPLRAQPTDVQKVRIREGLADLPTGAKPAGFLPPGFLFDGATLHAVADEGLDFILYTGGRSYMPDSIAVHDLVDYREADRREFVRSLPLGVAPGSAEGAVGHDYEVVQRAGGLYVVPFRVEEIAPGSVRFEAFSDLVRRARRDGTDILALSDALKWVDDRSQVRVEVRAASDDRASDSVSEDDVTAAITNTGSATVSNLVLRWSAGRTAARPLVDASGSGVRVRTDPETGTTLLYLPDLPPGATLELPLSLR